jgi:hypothetical protein
MASPSAQAPIASMDVIVKRVPERVPPSCKNLASSCINGLPSQHSMNFPSITRYASAHRCASERWWRKFGMEACRERAARFFPRPPCCTVARNRLFQRYSILARLACSAPPGARSTLMWSWHAHLTEQRPSPAEMAAREPAPSNWTHLHSRQARSFD